MKTALPFIISLFNAQLLSLSGSSVVHSILNFGPLDMKNSITGVQANLGNAKRIVASSELYKYSVGSELDNREYGLSVKAETIEAYKKIQSQSKLRHKEINMAIMQMLKAANGGVDNIAYEVSQGISGSGLLVDVVCNRTLDGKRVNFEFHHKSEEETTSNSLSIYILGKLKEYAINFGLAKP